MSSQIVLNYRKHDPKTTSIFEIVGSYFVDIYYNHLYAKAKLAQSRSKGTLTEEYKNAVNAYLKGIKVNREYYQKTIIDVHKHFQVHTNFNSVTIMDFIDKIINTIVPAEYLDGIISEQKDEFLTKFITDVIREFSTYVLKFSSLQLVIDNHSERSNVRLFQDEIINIMFIIKGRIYESFAKKFSGVQNSIPRDTMDRMKKAIELLSRKCNKLEAENEEYKRQMKKILLHVKDMQKENASLKKTNNKLTKALTELTEQLDEQSEESSEESSEEEPPPPKRLSKKVKKPDQPKKVAPKKVAPKKVAPKKVAKAKNPEPKNPEPKNPEPKKEEPKKEEPKKEEPKKDNKSEKTKKPAKAKTEEPKKAEPAPSVSSFSGDESDISEFSLDEEMVLPGKK